MEIVAAILDNECDPPNPYVIQLHCAEVKFNWTRIVEGHWDRANPSKHVWIPGQYEVSLVR